MRTYFNHPELSEMSAAWSRARELRDILGDDKGFKPIESLWRKIEAVQQGYEPKRDDDQGRLPLDAALKALAAEFKTAVNAYRVAAFTQRMPALNERLEAETRRLDGEVLEHLRAAWQALGERVETGNRFHTASRVFKDVGEECSGSEGVYQVGEQRALPAWALALFTTSGTNLQGAWRAYTERFMKSPVVRDDLEKFLEERI